MSLPPALAARLLKRGIIKQSDPEEEVIAEDYDEEDHSRVEDKSSKKGAPHCPNSWNKHHTCVEFCYKHWSNKDAGGAREVDADRERRRKKILKKYPLTTEWREIFDSSSSCYYYWNIKTDQVSWIPPAHPKAKICLPASKMPKVNMDSRRTSSDSSSRSRKRQHSDGEDEKSSDQESDDDKKNERRSMPLRSEKKVSIRSSRDRGRDRYRGGSKKTSAEELDPMDPASYSDIPRGTWSSGLLAETKSGVDSTVSGPLFQMRPYPSPGAILRANQTTTPDTKKKK